MIAAAADTIAALAHPTGTGAGIAATSYRSTYRFGRRRHRGSQRRR
jgi:hypothetical protein